MKESAEKSIYTEMFAVETESNLNAQWCENR